MRANQVRRSFSSVASVLLKAPRRLGRPGTEWAEAPCPTIRSKRLEVGALVRATVRTVWVRLASSCPYAEVVRRGHANLARSASLSLRC